MADTYRTLPIGTIFTYKGNKYQVCEYNKSVHSYCSKCAFCSFSCVELTIKSIRGECYRYNRTDNKDIYYKQITDEDNEDMNKNIIPTFKDTNSLNNLYIDCPKGYSIDLNNSDLSKGIIKFKKDNITLNDVYKDDNTKYATNLVILVESKLGNKLSAIAKLIDIANYYNVNWKPDWNNKDRSKYSIIYDNYKNNYITSKTYCINDGLIYFNNERDAQAVIDNPEFRDILDAIYKN